MKAKQKILAVLLAVFAVSFGYRIMNPLKQKTVDNLTYTGEETVKGKKISPESAKRGYGEINKIFTAFLTNPPHHSAKMVNNIFSGSNADNFPQNTENLESEVKEPLMEFTGSEITGNGSDAEISEFRAFGIYEAGDEKIVFLERGKDILSVKKGDIIDGKYSIDKISGEKIILKSEDSNEPLFIDMSELVDR